MKKDKGSMLRFAIPTTLLLITSFTHAQKPAVSADSIYFGGTIITVNDRQPSVEAVAVKGGRILAVGTKHDIFLHRAAATRLIDLHGKILLPGFVDGHSHFGAIVSGWGAPNLNPPPVGSVETIADIQSVVRKYIVGNRIPPGVAVSASGYDDSVLKERRHPNRVDLDAITTDQPLCLHHISGHLATCNSAALKAAGITRDTPDPPGGRIFRDPVTKEPTGVLGDHATGLVGRLFPSRSLDDVKKNFAAAQQYYASFGYTTVQEGASDARVIQLLREENAAGALKLDVISYPVATGVDQIIASQGIHIGREYEGHLKFAGVKLFGDGSPQGKTAFLREPYPHPPADAPPDYRGLALLTQDQFNEEYDKFFKRGWQVQTHCNGDACIDCLLTAVALADKKYGDNDRRPVVIHSQVVRSDQLDQYVQLHIIPSFFEAHTFYWGDWHRDEVLGPKRASFISPLHTAQEKDIRFSIHSDAPVTPPNALFLWWAAVNRQTRSQRVLGPAERVGAETALRALTIWAAYQQFDERSRARSSLANMRTSLSSRRIRWRWRHCISRISLSSRLSRTAKRYGSELIEMWPQTNDTQLRLRLRDLTRSNSGEMIIMHRRQRASITILAIASFLSQASAHSQQVSNGGVSQQASQWFAHLQYLASDDLKGRLIGTEGFEQAVVYVEDQYKQAGLKPAGTKGYRQPVPFDNVQIDNEVSALRIVRNGDIVSLKVGSDVTLNPHADANTTFEGSATFAGFGLSIPSLHIDDLAGLDLHGKIAVVLAGSPPALHGPLKAYFRSPAERWKALKAAGAVGVITIAEPPTRDSSGTQTQQRGGGDRPTYLIADPALDQLAGAQLSAVVIAAAAPPLFVGSSHTLEELQALAKAGKPLPKFALAVTIQSATAVKQLRHFDVPNVIGLLEGSDSKLKHEYVVISAHLDHLGVGRPVDGDSIYNGAMDNATGVASLLEIAKSIAAGPRPKRSILFATVTAEEEGLLGSRYFVHYPTVPREKIVADLNMDMFLPLFPLQYLEVQGLAESTLGNDIRAVAQLNGIEVQFDKQPDENRFVRSDQASFIAAGIPAIAFKFGWIPDSPEQKTFNEFVKTRYHHPSDDLAQPIDKEAAANFDHILEDLALRIANTKGVPQWYPESFFANLAK